MKWHIRAFAPSFAMSVFMALTAGAAADATPPAIPTGQENATPGPTTQNQEVSAVTGPRTEDPYYLPKGIPLEGPGGPLRLFPNLYASVGYDDNVYRGNPNFPLISPPKVSSSVFEVDPTLILDYDLERMRLDLYGQTSYQELNQYNLWTYNGGLEGRFEITHDTSATFNVSDGRFTEPYSSGNTIFGSKRPNEYQQFDASGKLGFKPSELGFTVGGSFDSYLFTRTPLIGGGSVPLGFRDANIEKGFVEASYDFSPGYTFFVRGTYNTDDLFHNTVRSSHGYNVDAGVDLLLGNLIQGQAYVGYLDQLYHKPAFRDVTGLDYGANLTWYPTELLIVRLAGARTLQNTILGTAPAGDDKSATLSLDYELLRRLHVLANVGYDDTNYRTVRDDKAFSAGIGGKFLLSHYAWIDANYEYTHRASTIPVAGYADNFVRVGLNLQD